MGARKNSQPTIQQSPVVNFRSLLASISPLVTLDDKLIIRYLNHRFKEEFSLEQKDFTGIPIFDVISISAQDRKNLLANIEKSKEERIQSEFKFKKKVYGYSIFRFANEIGIILKEITEKKKLEKKIVSLHSQLLKLQETERQKIARELHDSVGQTILAAKLSFQAYHQDPSRQKERFNVGLALIDQASEELREIYTNLYPSSLRELGLESAIRGFIKNFQDIGSFKIQTEIKIRKKLEHEIEINIYRVVQEIFTNIIKHAEAKEISIHLVEKTKTISLRIKDNGRGFNAEETLKTAAGFGLQNIKRRIEDMDGSLKLTSAPYQGTLFEIEVPVS